MESVLTPPSGVRARAARVGSGIKRHVMAHQGVMRPLHLQCETPDDLFGMGIVVLGCVILVTQIYIAFSLSSIRDEAVMASYAFRAMKR